MNWKIGNGTVLLLALVLSSGLIWYNVQNAPPEIPAKLEFQKPATVLNPYPELEGVKININTASEEELQILPNIGPARAKAICQYIADYGEITTYNQLQEIDGIGEKTIEQLLPYITL